MSQGRRWRCEFSGRGWNHVHREVDEGEGDTGNAVEPEARRGREDVPRQREDVIAVLHVLGVVSDKELQEDLRLKHIQVMLICAVSEEDMAMKRPGRRSRQRRRRTASERCCTGRRRTRGKAELGL